MLWNVSKKYPIAQRVRFADSLSKQAIGMMFSFKSRSALVFRFSDARRRALHMWFVFFPIDVLFLDAQQRIVEIKRNFRPFAVYIPKQKAQYIVELPVGTVRRCAVGDRVRFR